jgi:hypothetical protein
MEKVSAPATTVPAASGAVPSLARQAATFVLHFIEMCVSMCVGVALANVLSALVGSPSAGRETAPALVVLVFALAIMVPMIVWMRFRRMGWRPIGEMALAGLAAVALGGLVGLYSASEVQVGTIFGIECVGMLVAMLARLDLYTGRTGHHTGHAH